MDLEASIITADMTRQDRRVSGIAFAIMVAVIAIAPFFAYPFFVMQAMCFALFACAFNLLIGYANLLSLGHAMFFGLASYVCAHAAKVWGLEPVSAIAVGVAASAVLGFITGALAIRSAGIYFAMITVAFSQMVFFVCVEAPFTHGEDGIQAVPQGRALGFIDLSNPWILYCFVAAVFLFGFLVVQRAVNSPFGEILKAIRENEPRAVSLGYRALQYKLAAFVLSAVIAGLAGATKALVVQNASLTDVSFSTSGRGRADDAGRGHGHLLRPRGGRAHRHRDAELSRPVRRVGDRDPRRCVCRLRAGVPARHCRRTGGAGEGVALTAWTPMRIRVERPRLPRRNRGRGLSSGETGPRLIRAIHRRARRGNVVDGETDIAIVLHEPVEIDLPQHQEPAIGHGDDIGLSRHAG